MKNTFKTPNPGINYKDDKLFLFEENRIVVMNIDEHGPRAWEKSVENPFFKPAAFPELGYAAIKNIVSPPPEGEYIYWRTKEEMDFLNDHIDYSIIKQMAKFSYNIWQICALAMRADGLELIQSNPGIAYIVALNNIFMGKCSKPWRRARTLVNKKRKNIIEKAGFEGNNSIVKIIGKISPDALNNKNIFILRWMLRLNNDKILKTLRYLPEINEYVINILGNSQQREVISFNLLNELSTTNTHRHCMIVRDMFRLSYLLEIPLTANIKSIKQAEKVHNSFVDIMYERQVYHDMEYHEFSSPSIKDFSSEQLSIEHISNTFELMEWGKKQRNCLLSYNSLVADGNMSVFRVKTGNEEASLSIFSKNNNGEYAVDQLLGKSNKPVKAQTERYVKLWLNGLEKCITHWEHFPLPDLQEDHLSVKPLDNMEFILNLPFHQFKSITPEDITTENRLFFFQIWKPENGLIALSKIYGQWELVLARDIAGNDLMEATLQLIEMWLWKNTPEGQARQIKYNFTDNEMLS